MLATADLESAVLVEREVSAEKREAMELLGPVAMQVRRFEDESVEMQQVVTDARPNKMKLRSCRKNGQGE